MQNKKKYGPYPEASKAFRERNRIRGSCANCIKPREEGKVKCSGCLAMSRDSIKKKRLQVLAIYGNKCVCCGECTVDFLTFDHINNDGYKRRRRNGYNGTNIYYQLAKDNYPKDIQILCYNCNCGRARSKDKICPHKLKGEE